jgi:hypothetical protein
MAPTSEAVLVARIAALTDGLLTIEAIGVHTVQRRGAKIDPSSRRQIARIIRLASKLLGHVTPSYPLD